jgi:hypothetical protein
MSAYMDRKVLEVLDRAGPVGAVAYGCALQGREVSFDEAYQMACKQAGALEHPVQPRHVARGTFEVWKQNGERALRAGHERRACQGWRIVQR